MRAAFVAGALIVLAALTTRAFAMDAIAHYKDRVALFKAENAKLDPKARHVVLVGDSLTEGFTPARVKKFLPNVGPRTLNRGIGADGVGLNERGVLHRLDESVFACHPSHIFLLIGVNDLGRDGKGVDPAARVFEEVVKKIREGEKDAKLFVVTLAPTCKGYASMNPGIARYNEKLRAIATANGCGLVDLHARLVKDGALPEAFTSEGLHWTDATYEVLGGEIERAVAGK
jgi:lysophospholipase L1-like esterase